MNIEINEHNRGEAVELLKTSFVMREQQKAFFELDRKAKSNRSLYPERNQTLDVAKALERTFDERKEKFLKGLVNG